MSDQLVLTDDLHVGIGLRFSEVLAMSDGFTESGAPAGYLVHAADSLNSWQDGSVKTTFTYSLLATETLNFWADAILRTLVVTGATQLSEVFVDNLANWQDFVPNFTLTYAVQATEGFLLADLLDIGFGMLL